VRSSVEHLTRGDLLGGAVIAFNDFCLEAVKVKQLGLPQGLLLSPVLYILFKGSMKSASAPLRGGAENLRVIH
jgi:hypothetical protein